MANLSNVNPNVQMVLQPDFRVDSEKVTFRFFAADPGGGEVNDWYVSFTLAEFEAITNQNQLDTALDARLKLIVRGAAVTAKLGTLPGKIYTVA